MRLGLYGGSFDPVHLGHLLVARAAREELGLDRLVFIPAARSPFKSDTAPAGADDRLRWLRLALAGDPGCDVDDREIRRGGTSYTIDTVREYGRLHPGAELFWLVGADQIPALGDWREAEELRTRVQFAAVPRPGFDPSPAPPGFRVVALRGWPLSVSSSEIRSRLSRGLPIDPMTPAAVAEALVREHAYRDAVPPTRPSR